MTENQAEFNWNNVCQKAFADLKRILSLFYSFQKRREFVLNTDASNIEIDAVLSQKQDGKEKVIAYFSRVLSKAERNYCTTQQVLTIVNSFKSFHYLLD